MVFAELAILRSFKQAGWDGRWIDSYHQRYLTEYWPTPVSEPLPIQRQSILDTIRAKAGGTGGCFDVFCWRGEELIFAESKWRDKIRKTQTLWLEAALDIGIREESFLIVQWRFEERSELIPDSRESPRAGSDTVRPDRMLCGLGLDNRPRGRDRNDPRH